MIGVVHRTSGVNVVEYSTLGPLWAGTVLRGVWFLFGDTSQTFVDVALRLSDSPDATQQNLDAGVSLVSTDSAVRAEYGFRAMRFLLNPTSGVPWVIPVYVPIHESKFVIASAVSGVGILQWSVGLVVEPERLVRPALERGAAARRLETNAGVLERLRGAAVQARDLGPEVESGVK